MTGVQGMAFTAGGLPSSANKERSGGFCWDEAGSADFFDQYVELGDSDAESAAGAGGGGGFGQFGGASDLSGSPHLSWGQMLPPDGAGALVNNNNNNNNNSSSFSNNGNNNSSSNNRAASSNSAKPSRPPTHPLYRAATNMTAFSNPETGADGLYGSFEAPGSGSISDSELLKLEGLRMRSPHIDIPASEPASPLAKATSPRKASRLENFCTKIRNKAATLHGKGKQAEVKEELSVPVMSTAQMEPARTGRRPQNLHISKTQLPSPPLTSGMPGQGPASDASFVNGFLDDPFLRDGLLNGQFVPPLQLNGSTMPQTPMSTPLLDWQLPMASPNGKPLWTGAGPYFSGVNGDANTWWDPSADAMDTDPPPPVSYNAAANARNTSLNLAIQLQPQQSFEYPAPPGTEDTTFGPDLMLHMPQPRGIPSAVLHDTTSAPRPTRADHRRPKPRAPSSGARHHQYAPGVSPRKGRTASGGSSARRGSVSPGPKAAAPAAPGGARLHRRSASMQTLNQPAAGAGAGVSLSAEGPAHSAAVRKRRSWTGRRTSSSLHHQYHTLAVAAAAAAGGEAGSSPGRRRGNTTASSSSASHPGYQSHAHSASLPSHASFSNLPASHTHHPSSHLHHNPTSHTNNHTTSHHNSHPHPHPHPPSHHTTTTTTTTRPTTRPTTNRRTTRTRTPPTSSHHQQEEEDHQSAKDGFVNYTPQDHTLLMTGVAPSGSSKTKARREREAAERQRGFRERLARMVRAAGGDVSRLQQVEQLELEEGGGGGYGGGVGGAGRGVGVGMGGVGGCGEGGEVDEEVLVERMMGRVMGVQQRGGGRGVKMEEGGEGLGVGV